MRGAVAAGWVCAAVLLAGCSARAAEVVDGMTVEDAKSMTMAVEDDVVASVDRAVLGEIHQGETGILLSCSTESHRWAGGVDFFVEDGADMLELLQDIEESFATRDDFSVDRELDINGNETLTLRGPDGLVLTVSQWRREGFIGVLSFSPCFELPEGTYPGGVW